ncbi:unnamed protein product, partial [Amoebophrya sp. A25]|eukprot:GSA25T00014058001.1
MGGLDGAISGEANYSHIIGGLDPHLLCDFDSDYMLHPRGASAGLSGWSTAEQHAFFRGLGSTSTASGWCPLVEKHLAM